MRTVGNTIMIGAEPGSVWSVLTDFAAYGAWNPFIREVTGRLEQGATLTFTVSLGGERQTTTRAVIDELVPERRLSWRGGLPLGLLRGLHSFELQPILGGTSLLDQETFSGPLVPLLMTRHRLQTQQKAFVSVDEALRRRVEQRAAVAVPPQGVR